MTKERLIHAVRSDIGKTAVPVIGILIQQQLYLTTVKSLKLKACGTVNKLKI